MNIFKRRKKAKGEGLKKLKDKIQTLKDAGEKIPRPLLDLVGTIFPPVQKVRDIIQIIKGENDLTPLAKNQLLEVLEAYTAEQEQITERQRIDSGAEGWLTRNVRPLTLIFLLVYCAVCSVLNSLHAPNAAVIFLMEEGNASGTIRNTDLLGVEPVFFYMPDMLLLKWIGILTLGVEFYYGGRALTKLVQSFSGKNSQ